MYLKELEASQKSSKRNKSMRSLLFTPEVTYMRLFEPAWLLLFSHSHPWEAMCFFWGQLRFGQRKRGSRGEKYLNIRRTDFAAPGKMYMLSSWLAMAVMVKPGQWTSEMYFNGIVDIVVWCHLRCNFFCCYFLWVFFHFLFVFCLFST